MNMDSGCQQASRRLKNGEERSTIIKDITHNVMRNLHENYRLAQEITECPRIGHECTSDVIEHEGNMRVCPVFARIRSVDEIHECSYAKTILDNLKKHVIEVLVEAGVPRRHVDAFKQYKPCDSLNKALKYTFKDFILLCGPTGVGKSFAAACLCYKFAMHKNQDYFTDKTKWGDIDQWIKNNIGWYLTYEIATMMAKEQKEVASSHGLLVIDDLGIEDNTPRAVAAINYTISKRYDCGSDMGTIVTTNLSFEDIQVRYGKRLMDRLTESGYVVLYKAGN